MPTVPTCVLGYILYTTGIRLTNDSYQFLCAAKMLRETGSLSMCDGSPMVLSAPGFSLILSFFSEPIRAYTILSIFLYGTTLTCWLCLWKRYSMPGRWNFIPMVFGLPLFFPFLFLWSEGLFLFFFSLGVWCIEENKMEGNPKYLLGAAICFPAAICLRYAGLFIIVPVLAWELGPWNKHKSPYLLCVLALVGLTVAALASRSFVISHTFFGVREQGGLSFGQAFFQCALVIANWLLPVSVFGKISVGFLAIWWISVIWVDIKNAFVITAYFVFMIISAFATDVEHDERLFVPIYPLFALSIGYLLLKDRAGPLRWTVFQLWSAYLLFRFVKNILFWMN